MRDAPWLIALDLDGTVIHRDGSVNEAVARQIRRVAAAGHQVVLATGRSYVATTPVLAKLGVEPRFLVCSNGAVTLQVEPGAPGQYCRRWIESFDPTETLQLIRAQLGDAGFAVEDERGHHRYTGPIPDESMGLDSERVEFDDLLTRPATRVVVIAPGHDRGDFVALVDRIGLHHVTYTVGWTAWLDIARDGVTKATALERVRVALDVPRDRVMAVGDGLNDVEMLSWASKYGCGVAMGQAPAEVIEVATETTGTIDEDGLAQVLARL
jgi:hydroxymethylpyrimidine pyrophosphatase-like HAD family hydrolase